MSVNVVRFPVQKVMSARTAEGLLGAMRTYGYPELETRGITREEWIGTWATGKFVLVGWQAVKRGVVNSFREGRARHIVGHVSVGSGGIVRPRVEILCKTEMYPIWNWREGGKVKRTPVVLLAPGQEPYFALCKKCEAIMRSRFGNG